MQIMLLTGISFLASIAWNAKYSPDAVPSSTLRSSNESTLLTEQASNNCQHLWYWYICTVVNHKRNKNTLSICAEIQCASWYAILIASSMRLLYVCVTVVWSTARSANIRSQESKKRSAWKNWALCSAINAVSKISAIETFSITAVTRFAKELHYSSLSL